MIDKVRILGVSESARMLLLRERVEEALRHLGLGPFDRRALRLGVIPGPLGFCFGP